MKLIEIVETMINMQNAPYMKPLLVFDLDGTLIDSAPDICAAVNRLLEQNKKTALSDEVIISHIGEGLKKLIADVFRQDNLSADKLQQVTQDFLLIYQEEMFNKTRIFPGVEKFLEKYQGPIAIITNKNEAPAKAVVNHLNLNRFPWQGIFGADTLSECKPSPLPIETMMKLAGHKPTNTVMIGDGIPDVVSALRAGVPSIAIEFGYTPLHLLQAHQPRGILYHYDQLSDLIEKLFVTQ
jgi:phosphoglycolate phosphatase